MEKITCPNCSHRFDIEGVIAKDIKAQLDQELQNERNKLIEDKKQAESELSKQKQEFESKKKRQNEIFTERLNKAKEEQIAQLRKQVQDDFNVQLENQNKSLQETQEKLKYSQQKELELLQTQRKMNEQLQNKELEMQRQLNQEREQIHSQVKKAMSEELELKLKEKDTRLQQQNKLIEELKRKSEQGSMQLQGEVQELAIEDYLRQAFIYDRIEEVKKGSLGADTVQVVIDDMRNECGKIVYESKRTKSFGKDWIAKLKSDQRRAQADIAVLVTQVMPKEMDRFGEKDGVWICNYDDFKGLSHVLREIVIRSAAAHESQSNKGDKMELLYAFLTSQEFKLQINGIVEGFQTMKSDLDREKMAMRKIWKSREKQLEIIISNTIDMYGSIKGIAGAAVPAIDNLELDQTPNLDTLI